MKVYIACNDDGFPVEIIKRKYFRSAYNDTIGRNTGSFLVELSKKDFKRIKKLFEED